jgi:hypothetical protein
MNRRRRATGDIRSLIQSIDKRWEIRNWQQDFSWWRSPAQVRILIYGDSGMLSPAFGIGFLGLDYVKTLLTSNAYWYVNFQVSTADRDGQDPTASIPGAKKLTDLDIVDDYDEIWLFGFNSTPNLTPDELMRLDEFMSAPKYGGVLVTGDHADIGKGITGQIKRAGKMRRYPAPDLTPPHYNTTVVEGPDANSIYQLDDQADDVPQPIRFKRYTLGGSRFLRFSRPHPVLCSPDGPIDVFPDHLHEGEAMAPVPIAGDTEWPTKAGHQEAPEVIAWGTIKDPSATKHGQEIGLVSAYDGHNVDVGRILADSTWHHWLDVNLTGLSANVAPYAGFDATPAGQAALKKIDAYFLNCGVWLAPPAAQAAMRNAGWWSVLGTDIVAELRPDLPLSFLGDEAINALGRRAPRCTVAEWIFEWPIFKEKIPWWEWPEFVDRFTLIDIPIERYIAGGMLQMLLKEFAPIPGKRAFPKSAPDDKQLEKALQAGIDAGLSQLGKDLQREATLASQLSKADFRFKQLEQATK